LALSWEGFGGGFSGGGAVLFWGLKTGSKPGQPANYFKQTSFLSLYNSLGSRGVEKRVGEGGSLSLALFFNHYSGEALPGFPWKTLYTTCVAKCVWHGAWGRVSCFARF